ncbi:hypothetical protein DFH07DRAFT_1031480 [Mycena maculata]|uniref:INO80 complex subunit F domain-containing protein n=1 Tax=Mycena maculata TaxID=230809 RepID=A0AAD7N9T9_9AGAR|nr:hypothetical protein DFH07DRAFT_1031480 [Mycena maculata]
MASVPTPPPPQAPFPIPSQRQTTQPPFTVGIAAGAEDVKYQAKYKDLKRKVKEIEADNDKLHFKVLQAKRSIQRMKLERASVFHFFSRFCPWISQLLPKSVLYERLQQVPPSPEIQDRLPLPPVHPSPHQQAPQHHGIPPNHMDRTPPDYIRTHGGTLRQEGRAGTMDSPLPPGALPHGAHSSRRGSLPGGPEPRQLQFMQHLPPVQQDPHRGHAQIHNSPHMHHPNASHERARSQSRGRAPVYHPHPQQYPDVQQVQQQQHPLHSPPLSERGHSRRHDLHELAGPHVDSRARHQNSIPPLSPSSDARSGRVHSHQRMGPGTYINRDDMLDRDRDRELERTRDWERERERGRGRDMRSPPMVHRSSRPAMDRAEYPDPHAAAPRRREDQSYYAERRVYSRSNSAGSASRSGSPVGEAPSRPDSRTQFYEPDRARSFRLRPVAHAEEVDFVHEDGRPQLRDRNGGGGGGGGGGYAPEPSRPPLDSRKRSRNDMDVDDADDGPPGATTRLVKRYHQISDHM